MRRLLLLPLFALLTACGDGTGPELLGPEDTSGVYQICALNFTPTQTALPQANVLANAINSTPPAGALPPTLRLSTEAPEYQIAYTLKNNFTRLSQGTTRFGANTVTLELATGSAPIVVNELLLPNRLELNFQPTPKTLTVENTGPFPVRRADYARIAGISEEGLQDTIQGTLTARFVVTGSSCN